MFITLMVILSIIGGALLSIQAAVNARLAETQGSLRATFVTFLVGAILSGLLVFFLEPAHTVTVFDVPKWQLMGSFLGLIYVLTMVYAVQRIGTAIATVAVILGQLLMSILIDTFGWLGSNAIDLSWNRIFAACCLAASLYFIYRGEVHNSVKK